MSIEENENAFFKEKKTTKPVPQHIWKESIVFIGHHRSNLTQTCHRGQEGYCPACAKSLGLTQGESLPNISNICSPKCEHRESWQTKVKGRLTWSVPPSTSHCLLFCTVMYLMNFFMLSRNGNPCLPLKLACRMPNFNWKK